MFRSGREFCRGGRRGGSLGAGLGGAATADLGGGAGERGGGAGDAPSTLRTGGLGKLRVSIPVVFT